MENGNIGNWQHSHNGNIAQLPRAIVVSDFARVRFYDLANDRAVLAAYGLAADTPEPEIVAHLFKLYAEAVKGQRDRVVA